jgi:hypothetical protein
MLNFMDESFLDFLLQHLSSMNYQFLNGIPFDEPSHLNLERVYVLLMKYCSGKSLKTNGIYSDDDDEQGELSIDVFGITFS